MEQKDLQCFTFHWTTERLQIPSREEKPSICNAYYIAPPVT